MLSLGSKIIALLGLATLVGCGDSGSGSSSVPVTMIDRSNLTNVGTSGPLDYSDPNLWMCRPGNEPNECHIDLDSTQLNADGSRTIVPEEPASHPQFDCFYVYPTVDLSGDGNMTNFSDVSLVRDPLYAQAARFTRLCEVYAPLYRQVSLSGTSFSGDPALALQDVHDAFRFYLEHLNHGRNFVIMGHSQGSAVLASMMQADVDPVPAVRSHMISAVLLGGGLTVAAGQRTGGTFQNIPTCGSPGETGCVIAYSSYDATNPPGANALFGHAPAGFETACVNPGPLAGNDGLYQGSYFPLQINQPIFRADEPLPSGITTPFLLYRNVFRGDCVNENGFSYLRISLQLEPGDARSEPPYRTSVVESLGFGLHLVDYNIPLDDLIGAVARQAEAMR